MERKDKLGTGLLVGSTTRKSVATAVSAQLRWGRAREVQKNVCLWERVKECGRERVCVRGPFSLWFIGGWISACCVPAELESFSLARRDYPFLLATFFGDPAANSRQKLSSKKVQEMKKRFVEPQINFEWVRIIISKKNWEIFQERQKPENLEERKTRRHKDS